MSNTELLQYKRYLQRYVFAGWEAPDDLKEWVRLLERHILNADMQTEDEGDTLFDELNSPSGNCPDIPPAGGLLVEQLELLVSLPEESPCSKVIAIHCDAPYNVLAPVRETKFDPECTSSLSNLRLCKFGSTSCLQVAKHHLHQED